MDDMKRLIERYKQELMEYDRAAARSAPVQKLQFPEMVAEPVDEEPDVEANDPVEEDMTPPVTDKNTSDQELPAEDFSFVYTPDISDDTYEDTSVDDVESDGFVGDAPESGEDISEQLANRPFEPEVNIINSPEDVQPLVQSGNPTEPFIEPEYEDIEAFYDANPKRGLLKFTTYTASGALPVPNAKVVVYKTIGGRDNAFYTYITDMSGQTPEMRLAAPSSELSQAPSSSVQPFSLYDAFISARGYNDVLIRDIPVFEGITSLQRVAMVPSAGINQLSQQSPDLTEVRNARE